MIKINLEFPNGSLNLEFPIDGVEPSSIRLVDHGPKKLAIIKVIRNATGRGLKEAKEYVESLPHLLRRSDLLPGATLGRLRADMVAEGASCDVQGIIDSPQARLLRTTLEAYGLLEVQS